MSLHEAIWSATFLGVKHESGDIVDYIAIRAALAGSLLIGAVAAVWLGVAAGPWAAVLAGIGAYAASMRLCAVAFFPRGRRG
ncbi:MAG TPA: hypothetical protein VEF54_02140 [archaeon]|nr:hypothetical protein [archaeon]